MPGASPNPFDVDRLSPEERKLWDEHFAVGTDSLLIRVWSFGYWCTLALDGVPAVVSEWLAREDPDNLVGQYLTNVRRARAPAACFAGETDEVLYEFGPDEVVFKWAEPKFAVVIDLEGDGPGGIDLPAAEETRPAPGRLAGCSTLEPTARQSREAGSRVASIGPLARTLNGWEPPGPRI